MTDQLDEEGLLDVECGAAIEEALENDNPLLQRALRRIRALEGGVRYADERVNSLITELRRIRDVVFPRGSGIPTGDALYLAIKETFEAKTPPEEAEE